MVARQDPAQDVDTVLPADLAADVPHAQADAPSEHFETVLRRPDQMISMVENAVAAGVILHDLTL